jgi:hypothetical protein
MAEENKRMNFFREFLKSIKDLDKYEDFALELPKNTFKYFIKLIVLFSIIASIFYTIKIGSTMQNVYNNLKEKIPDFSYEDGIITTQEEPTLIEDYKDSFGEIIIDTSIEENEINKYQENGSNIQIIFLKDKCIIKNNSLQQVYRYLDLAESYNIEKFTKQSVIEYVEQINAIYLYFSIYVTIFICIAITYFISIILDTLILSLLAYLVARISRIKFNFGTSFNVAVHSITLSVVLRLIYIIVNLMTGFTVKYFELMYSTISYIYVIVGILMIKTDFVNRQMELIKLAQEQKKVKEELEQEKEEKDKKPDKKKEPKDKEKNEDEEKPEGEVNPSTIQENK